MKSPVALDRAADCGYQISALMRIVQDAARSNGGDGQTIQASADIAMLCEIAEDLAGEYIDLIETHQAEVRAARRGEAVTS